MLIKAHSESKQGGVEGILKYSGSFPWPMGKYKKWVVATKLYHGPMHS